MIKKSLSVCHVNFQNFRVSCSLYRDINKSHAKKRYEYKNVGKLQLSKLCKVSCSFDLFKLKWKKIIRKINSQKKVLHFVSGGQKCP